MRFRLYASIALAALFFARCATSPTGPEAATGPATPPVIEQEAPPPPPEEAIGTVVVRASALNVRDEPTTDAATLDKVRRGTRLSLIREENGWSRVRLADGRMGWVSSRYVRALKNCEPDRNFRFIEAPPLSFSQGGPHGVVTVDATVNLRGVVVKTKVTSNTTGDASLAELAEKEIRSAKFDNPIRNCRPIEFIYVYRRTF